MTLISDNPEVWGAVLAALGIAWKKYRSERRNGKGKSKMHETCPSHAAVKERLEFGNERFAMLEQGMSEVKTGIATIVERVASIKEMVLSNRETVTDQFHELKAMINGLSKDND